MGPVVVLTGLVAACVLFCFLRFQPEFANKRALGAVNLVFLCIAAGLSGVFTLYVRSLLTGTMDEKWWPPLALSGTFAISSTVLLLGLVARWWIFRPPSRPGSGFFG